MSSAHLKSRWATPVDQHDQVVPSRVSPRLVDPTAQAQAARQSSPRSPLPENTLELGESPYPTSRHHAAQFMIHVLLNIPYKRLAWGILMIRGIRREVMINGKWYQYE